MEILNYDQKYEDEVVDLWNKCCSFDTLSKEKFRRQALFDENFNTDLCKVAIENNKVVGFVLATKRKFPYLERGLEPLKGWINVLFVDSEYRRKNVGSLLLKSVETLLLDMGVKKFVLGAYSPNYFFAGLDPINHQEAVLFFEKHGYVAGSEHYSMCKNLHGFKLTEKQVEKKKIAMHKGYQFIKFDYRYSLELLEFLKDEFGGGWKRNALIAMQTNRAEDTILIVLDPKGKICGFCMRMIDLNPMRFGPIGIGKDYRNEGIGSVLINFMFEEMAKKSIYHMYFMTTDDAGKRYYLREGLEQFRSFIEYEKEII